jgi:hypothetical protein
MTTIAEYGVKLGLERSDINERIDSELGRTGRKVEGFFDGLKAKFGRRSILGETGELLAGGGVVAGFSMLGNVLSDATAKAVELKDALKDSDKNAADIIDEFAKGLPIIGGFYRTGSNIRELFTGEKAAVREANEEIKRQDAYFESMRRGADSFRKAVDDAETRIRNMQRTLAAFGKPAPMPAMANVANTLDSQIKAINTAEKEARKTQEDEFNKNQLPFLKSEVDKAKKDLDDSIAHARYMMGGSSKPADWLAASQQEANALQSAHTRLATATKAHNDKLQEIADNANTERQQARQKAQDDESEAIDRFNKDNAAKAVEREDFLRALESKGLEDRTAAKIVALEKSGNQLAAAQAHINAEYDRAGTEAIIDVQKKIAEAGDAEFAARAEKLLDQRLAALKDKRDADLAKAEADEAERLAKAEPATKDMGLAKQETTRRFTLATLAERGDDGPGRTLTRQVERQIGLLQKIVENTSAHIRPDTPLTASLFNLGS